MAVSRNDAWNRARQSFADQFEPAGTNYIYRRSQKGEAIQVTAEERNRFVDRFNRDFRRSIWIMSIAMALALGGVILFSSLRGFEPSQGAIFAAMAVAVIPYFIYFRWAWAAPARALSGRTPIAGERSPEEVQRLKFGRMTYAQLASAAAAGVAMPFLVRHQNVFAGWNRLWLVFGGAIVLLAGVQAFRKWRFEQDDSYRTVIPRSTSIDLTRPIDDDGSSQTRSPIWRYVPAAVILIGIALVAYTAAGRRLAQTPSFWPIVLIGIGGWALFTVVQGFSKGSIEPFVRGAIQTYDRDTQPKRFWASMAWNSIFGLGCAWFAFQINHGNAAQSVRDRCYNEDNKYQPQDSLSACNQIIDNKTASRDPSLADAFLGRGVAYAELNDRSRAVDDYSEALRLQPRYFEAYFDRGLAYQLMRDNQQAIADYSAAVRIRPDPNPYFRRGMVYGRIGDLPAAIADFSEVVRLKPRSAWGYYYRALAYRQMGDTNRATADFGMAFRLDPKLCGGCRQSDS